MTHPIPITLASAILLALAHLWAGRLRFLEGIPRSRWLSFAGGVSVAYVFLHILPELGSGQETFDKRSSGVLEALAHHTYLLALIGLAVFYGLERMALRSRKREGGREGATGGPTFWTHIATYALYNAVIGYLLVHRDEQGFTALLWYVVAIGLHFVVNDFGLWEHHKQRYRITGRWVLAGAVLVGWLAGVLTDVSEMVVVALFAFVAGGIVLNVLKEELPEERESRFPAFALGAALYAVLLVAFA